MVFVEHRSSECGDPIKHSNLGRITPRDNPAMPCFERHGDPQDEMLRRASER